jgi:hypothetical protein
MKSALLAPLLSAFGVASLLAATDPVRIISTPVDFVDTPPTIDATVWINETVFNILNDRASTNRLPYRSQNTVAFTNIAGGQMFGVPGFHFVTDQKGKKTPMRAWANEGTIRVDYTPSTNFSLPGLPPSEGSLLSVQASNILNTGPMEAGLRGVVQLQGGNMLLNRSGLRAGPQPDLPVTTNYLGASNYLNSYGVQDLHWGLGNNNVLVGAGNPLDVSSGLSLPCPFSPVHEVYDSRGTNSVFLPLANLCAYGAAANYQFLSATSYAVQVVFYPTNFSDTNFSTTVQFGPAKPGGGSTVTLGFHNTEFDIVWRSNVTYSLYFQDDLAFRTNVALAVNQGATTRRPDSYAVFRGSPGLTNGFGVLNGNLPYTNGLLWNPSYATNLVPSYYTAYGARIHGFVLPTEAFLRNNLWDSTNLLGRVDILGTEANLTRTRVRAESSAVIQAPRLVNNRLSSVDAPFVNFNVGSAQPELIITNLAPATVRRINGYLRCWSSTWDNFEYVTDASGTNVIATNLVRFHVLLLDHDLNGQQPVTTDRFLASVGSLIVQDPLTVGRNFRFTGADLTFASSGGLRVPTNFNLGASNLVGLVNFTNHGFIHVPFGEAHWGDDRVQPNGQPNPLQSFDNRGTNSATSFFLSARQVVNTGTLEARSGRMALSANRIRLLGGDLNASVTNVTTNIVFDPFTFAFVTNVSTNFFTNALGARLTSRSSLDIRARNLIASNSVIDAGRLVVAVTNNLLADDRQAPNVWITSGGLEFTERPTNSGLMAVTLHSKAAFPFQQNTHFWPARDRGPVNTGFSNNLALGHLVLDGAEDAVFRFGGTRPNRALYVDYLELANYATNYVGPNRSLRVDTNLVIYFANASVPAAKLTNAYPGRVQWISSFTGPLSTTNITCLCSNADGTFTATIYAMNIALATSKDLDTDGDNLVNAIDPDPLNRCRCPAGFLVPAQHVVRQFDPAQGAAGLGRALADLQLQILLLPAEATAPAQVELSWDAPAGAHSILEYRGDLTLNNWQVMTNYPAGPSPRRLTVTDTLSKTGQRFYRVRAGPPSE